MKNLTQEGTASCREFFEESPEIGELVRIDVGEILTSSNEKGNIHVVLLEERILNEQPDGTWKKGYVSGIWRTKGGSFYYEIHEILKPSGDQTPSVPNICCTWRTIGGIQLFLRPRWSKPTDEVAFETLGVPEERMTLGQKWTHDKRVNEAAMKAEEYLGENQKTIPPLFRRKI